MTPLENIKKGHRNQENGAYFEKQLAQLFNRMAEAGWARIIKVPEPLRVIGPGEKGVFKAIYIRGAAAVDYQGTLMGGRAVYLEAKHTASEHMDQARVADRQAEAMDLYASLGASCGVLVTFKLGCCGLVPWAAWRRMKELFGRKYLRAEDLEKMGWEFGLFDAKGLVQSLHGLSLFKFEKP